jgi:hypothetical protein
LPAPQELTQDQVDAVRRWAVHFNGERPADGSFTQQIIDGIGPIPVNGQRAREVALEYFESKLPAAITRRSFALQQTSRDGVPLDYFNAVDYWNRAIDWFKRSGQ